MHKYRSKCRWNMLIYVDGQVVEIRPSELFESKGLVNSRYLELIDKPIKVKKVGRPKKSSKSIFLEDKDVNTSSGT